MKGFNISCADLEGGCTTAIRMTGNNSVVKSTGQGPAGDPQPRVIGPFVTGVNCASKTGSRATGLRLEGWFITGIGSCAKVDGNVLIGAVFPNSDPVDNADTGISTGGIANDDLIADNYLDGFERQAIRVVGTREVSVDHNIIVQRVLFPELPQELGILIGPTAPAAVTNNVIMGDSSRGPISAIPQNSGDSYQNNFCDPTMAGCAGCMSAGYEYCTTAVAPFTFP